MVHLNTNNTTNNTYIRDANTQGTHEIERILVTNNTKKNFYILGLILLNSLFFVTPRAKVCMQRAQDRAHPGL